MTDMDAAQMEAYAAGRADEREECKWQPIETAPKDEYIIVWPPTFTGVVSCAKWNEDEYAKRPQPYWERSDDMGRVTLSRETPPTHWMPQLKPPKDQS